MSGQVVARIRERILSGAYAPGAPLLQDAIAAEFGVSKIPVREALVQLRAEGLLDVYAHRGFQVRPVSLEEVSEVFRLRLEIEPRAVAEGSRSGDENDRSAAEQALAALNAALAHGEFERSGDLNAAFHLSLIVPRLQPVTHDVLVRLHTLSQRYVRLHLQRAGRARRANREHTELCTIWRAKKAKEAERLAAAHIAETRDELVEALHAKGG